MEMVVAAVESRGRGRGRGRGNGPERAEGELRESREEAGGRGRGRERGGAEVGEMERADDSNWRCSRNFSDCT